ncbi:MAG: HPr(Ser) kinase/phosphatase [Oscillospiraceae bacterium]
MATKYSVQLSHLIAAHKLQSVYLPKDAAEIEIVTTEVNRPGLQIAGFYEYFDAQRLQIFGMGEFAYLQGLNASKRAESMDRFFASAPVASVVARDLPIFSEMMDAAKKHQSPLLHTELPTSEFMSAVISTLNVEMAPRQTRHGVLVEVHGEGILLLGESGVGKSETAMELVKRGHRLIADDAVEVRRVSAKTLVGTSPENIRHFMELRGIGIINVRQIFGIGAVKVTQQIDMVINLELWDQQKNYDRMGMENEYCEILGNQVPCLTIPVKPGRNLAIIIEVAAMNNRQKMMGYNSAKELLSRLGMLDEEDNKPAPTKYDGWGSI